MPKSSTPLGKESPIKTVARRVERVFRGQKEGSRVTGRSEFSVFRTASGFFQGNQPSFNFRPSFSSNLFSFLSSSFFPRRIAIKFGHDLVRFSVCLNFLFSFIVQSFTNKKIQQQDFSSPLIIPCIRFRTSYFSSNIDRNEM